MVAEIRYGVETIDHIAIPVRDLEFNQNFYINTLGLEVQNHPAQSRRQLRAKPTCSPATTSSACTCRASAPGRLPSAGPRIGISVTSERFDQVEQNLTAAKHPFKGPVEHAAEAAA